MGKVNSDQNTTPVATAVVVAVGRSDETTPLVKDAPSVPPATAITRTWKDGLCGCCKFGPCHPSLLNALCCPQILMAQVLTRLRLDMFGNPESEHSHHYAPFRSTFQRILAIVATYYIVQIVFACYVTLDDIDDGDVDDEQHELEEFYIYNDEEDGSIIDDVCPQWKRILTQVVSVIFGLYTLVVMMKLRAAVRAKYGIEGGCFQDLCCIVWCQCCTVSQMARQTANYDTYAAQCCAPTGLPVGIGEYNEEQQQDVVAIIEDELSV